MAGLQIADPLIATTADKCTSDDSRARDTPYWPIKAPMEIRRTVKWSYSKPV